VRVEPHLRAPWPWAVDLVREELEGFLTSASSPGAAALPTRCAPWTVRDVVAHVGLTFERFGAMLERGRAGDLSVPFPPDELAAVNRESLRAFDGESVECARTSCATFLGLVREPDEVMPHQFGPIPVSLQVLFGLGEIAIHHDDIQHALGRSYRPREVVVRALLPVWERALRRTDGSIDDPWLRIVAASGR